MNLISLLKILLNQFTYQNKQGIKLSYLYREINILPGSNGIRQFMKLMYSSNYDEKKLFPFSRLKLKLFV